MKPTTSTARSNPKSMFHSTSSSKTLIDPRHSKVKTPVVTVKSSKMERTEKKEKLGSLENISKEMPRVCGSKLKVPNIFQDRYSAGSPAKLNTPIRLRNSDSNMKASTPEIFTAVRFETPKRYMCEQAGVNACDGVETSNLVVAVRVRPQTVKEKTDKAMNSIVQVRDNEISVLTDYGQTHSFNYDHCFPSDTPATVKQLDQAKVYEGLAKPLLTQAFKGFNTCLFAYGQTGSGKSYSVMGNIGSEKELDISAGIVPRFCYDLFRKVEILGKSSPAEKLSFEIQISYFEIYKEKIQDLLCPSSKLGGSLRVREHPQNVRTIFFVLSLCFSFVC